MRNPNNKRKPKHTTRLKYYPTNIYKDVEYKWVRDYRIRIRESKRLSIIKADCDNSIIISNRYWYL